MAFLHSLHAAVLRAIGIQTFGSSADIFDSPVYQEWRATRIHKLTAILGTEWFANKRILEMGAAFGGVGLVLADLGAQVTFAEGRSRSVKTLKQRVGPRGTVVRIDNDRPWAHRFAPDAFDLVIHWGLLYHLTHWRADLRQAVRVAPLVSLESEVLHSDEAIERRRREYGADMALRRVGTVMSARAIEDALRDEIGVTYRRYDDADLNAGPYIYDWTRRDPRLTPAYALRRFWMITHPGFR